MSDYIVDSSLPSLAEALRGLDFPFEVRRTLQLIDVEYVSFDGVLHRGQLVLHRDLAEEAKEIFRLFLKRRFPIERVVPLVAYGWSDEASMAANNSSAFNYRLIIGTDRLSEHSLGRALDINPKQNPYFARDGKVYPEGSVYDLSVPGTLTEDGDIVKIFKAKGWDWGGNWTVPVDYQHFQKLS